MPKRPPTLTERLRSAWAQRSPVRAASATDTAAPPRSADPGSTFAERLRAAVATRH